MDLVGSCNRWLVPCCVRGILGISRKGEGTWFCFQRKRKTTWAAGVFEIERSSSLWDWLVPCIQAETEGTVTGMSLKKRRLLIVDCFFSCSFPVADVSVLQLKANNNNNNRERWGRIQFLLHYMAALQNAAFQSAPCLTPSRTSHSCGRLAYIITSNQAHCQVCTVLVLCPASFIPVW